LRDSRGKEKKIKRFPDYFFYRWKEEKWGEAGWKLPQRGNKKKRGSVLAVNLLLVPRKGTEGREFWSETSLRPAVEEEKGGRNARESLPLGLSWGHEKGEKGAAGASAPVGERGTCQGTRSKKKGEMVTIHPQIHILRRREGG